MTNELPPPSYSSLFQEPSATPLGPLATPPLPASFSQQTSDEPSFPPPYPFCPGLQDLTALTPNREGSDDALPGSGILPPGESYTPQPPVPYTQEDDGRNPEKPRLSGIKQLQATPSDPLMNQAYPVMVGNPQYSAITECPTTPETVMHTEIPVIIVDQPGVPVNTQAPQQCIFGQLEDVPGMHIAPGQEKPIYQLDPHEKPSLLEWCCLAFWSIGAHVSVVVCIVLLVWQVTLKQEHDTSMAQATQKEHRDQSDRSKYSNATLVCASVFLVLCYLIAVFEGFVSDTDTYLQNLSHLNKFRNDFNHVRRTVPTVVWKAEAFHHATQDNNQEDRSRSSDKDRCVTYREVIAFPFSKCVDATGSLDEFKQGAIYRFKFEKTFGFMDAATKAEYNSHKASMIARVKNRDADHSFEETWILPEMKEHSIMYMEEGCGTAFLSLNFYRFLTCIMCTWPYRAFFRMTTKKKKYTFVKLIGI